VSRRSGLLVLALLALALPARSGAPGPERIGPYELAPLPGGIEIRSAPAPRLTPVLAAVGAALALGALVVGAGTRVRGPALALLAAGLACVAGAAVLRFDRLRVVAGEAGLECEGLLGARRFDAAALAEVEIAERRPTGPELKRAGAPRVWQVSVRLRDGGPAARFRLSSRDEAEALAARLASALGRGNPASR
jgi:hypothetical protein